VVVDFTVENNRYGTVFVADGLVTRGEVDDTEAAHAQADLTLREKAVVIRAAVRNNVAHAAQGAGIDVTLFAKLKYSCDSTHAVIAPTPEK
jgi:hypothetical protein